MTIVKYMNTADILSSSKFTSLGNLTINKNINDIIIAKNNECKGDLLFFNKAKNIVIKTRT